MTTITTGVPQRPRPTACTEVLPGEENVLVPDLDLSHSG